MAREISSTLSVMDTAVGPVAIKESVVDNYDIEDFIHDVLIDHAEKLSLYQKATRADKDLAENRTPVAVGDANVGGFNV